MGQWGLFDILFQADGAGDSGRVPCVIPGAPSECLSAEGTPEKKELPGEVSVPLPVMAGSFSLTSSCVDSPVVLNLPNATDSLIHFLMLW